MKKRVFPVALIVIALCLIGSAIVISFNEKNNKTVKEKVVPLYVGTPDLSFETFHLNSLHFSNLSVSKLGNKYVLFLNVINEGENLKNNQLVEVILFDIYNKEIARIQSEILNLEKDGVFQDSIETNSDISKAVKFEVKLIKEIPAFDG